MEKRLKDNGFSYCTRKVNKHENKSNANNDFVYLSMDFIGDRFHRKIKKIIKKYDLPIRVTSKPGNILAQTFNGGSRVIACNCDVCDAVGPKFTCNDRYVVYNFNCKLCGKNYIGQTCRPLKIRSAEHCRSLKNRDRKSALSEHVQNDHIDIDVQIDQFHLSVLTKQRSSVHTRLAESRYIRLNKPQLNRKHEMV